MADTQKHILYVEDRTDDILLVQRAWERVAPAISLAVAESGQQALEMMGLLGGGSGQRIPDLVVTDIRMPGISGFELLERIKANSKTAALPVVVLSTSDEGSDVHRARKLGASGYAVKVGSLRALENLIRKLEAFLLKDEEMGLWPEAAS